MEAAGKALRFDLHELLFDLVCLVDLMIALALYLSGQRLYAYPSQVVRSLYYLLALYLHSFLVQLVPPWLPPSPLL